MKQHEGTMLGEVLRKWRLMSNLEQRGASRLMNISAATLCRLERGDVKPDAETWIKIQRFLLDPPPGGTNGSDKPVQ